MIRRLFLSGYDFPDIQATAEQAGTASARAVEELDERMRVMAQPFFDVSLCQGAFLDAGSARPL